MQSQERPDLHHVRYRVQMQESKALAQNVALQASDQCHALKKELWEVRTVNNDLCLEVRLPFCARHVSFRVCCTSCY